MERINNSPKTGGVQNIGLSMSYKDIFKATTGEKTGISATSSIVNVAGSSTDFAGKKDREFVNGDFDGSLSLPIQLLTSKGREQTKDAFKNFGKNMKGSGSNLMDLGSKTAGYVRSGYNAVVNWMKPEPKSYVGPDGSEVVIGKPRHFEGDENYTPLPKNDAK